MSWEYPWSSVERLHPRGAKFSKFRLQKVQFSLTTSTTTTKFHQRKTCVNQVPKCPNLHRLPAAILRHRILRPETAQQTCLPKAPSQMRRGAATRLIARTTATARSTGASAVEEEETAGVGEEGPAVGGADEEGVMGRVGAADAVIPGWSLPALCFLMRPFCCALERLT